MRNGYTLEEIKENNWNIDNFEQCQGCLKWFPVCDTCEDDEGVTYCERCL